MVLIILIFVQLWYPPNHVAEYYTEEQRKQYGCQSLHKIRTNSGGTTILFAY